MDRIPGGRSDRLARNLQDYAELEEMARVTIISATESLPAGATGRFVGSIHAAVSRYYSDQLGERVTLALRTKAQQGLWPAPAPIGYVNTQGPTAIEPDSAMGPIVRELFETYARGNVSLSELVQRARELGLRSRSGLMLGKSAIHHLLTHPIYCGVIRWEGEVYEGLHEPLVTRSLFEEVGRRLQDRSSPQVRRDFAFRGLLRCGYCGCAITASLEKKRYVYYHCTRSRGRCQQSFMREEALGTLLEGVVQRVHMSMEQVRELVDLLRSDAGRREEETRTRISQLRDQVVALQQRRDALYEDKLDGKIPETRWLELDQRWSQTADRAERQIRLLEAGGLQPGMDELQATFELLERAPRLYQHQSNEERARLLRALTSNCILRGNNIAPIYRKPFDLVAEGLECSTWLPG